MENKILNDQAYRAYLLCKNKAAKENYKIDPLTLLTILTILLKIIEIFLTWYGKRPRKCAEAIFSLNFIKRSIIWHYVRKEVTDKKTSKYVYNSICEVFHTTSLSELEKMFSFHIKERGKK